MQETDAIYFQALDLKREFPRCRDVIDGEVARLREEIKAEPHRSPEMDQIHLRQRVMEYPCAKKITRRRAGGKTGRRRGR